MRTGILGGAFDPIHSGHIALARAAISVLRLDRLLLIPSGDPPYKKLHASRGDRLIMAMLTKADVPGTEVCDIEITRPGHTYAADTLRLLHSAYPDDEFIYILGSDAAARVGRWKDADIVSSLCSFACVVRKGWDEPVPEGMLRLDTDAPEISSAEIRAAIASGRAAAGILPESVWEYVRHRGLYIAEMPEEEIISDLKKRLKPGRFKHTMGVADTCAELAQLNGAPVGKAYVAGLLHDCAKYMKADELLALADAAGADADERQVIPVMHAPVGAYIARTRYGVQDGEVLSAIRRHTVGAEDMSLLDAIVYVADMVEPNRAEFTGLARARLLARQDVFSAAAFCARLTRDYNKDKGAIHPMTEKMIHNIETGGIEHG